MKRPIEPDYTSHVAYTRALEAYCDWLSQTEQEPSLQPIQTDRREHENGKNCWCNPTLVYKDPDTGNEVWVHNLPN